MAVNSTFTPKASLTDAPTNLKEAIDWVLRVTGRDGKPLENGECICGLAAAVTDLLQSVELEYHGYQGESNGKGATPEKVKEHLNGLFSLVQGLGGTAVVRTYIDQLAQVLSALVGWSKIVKCEKKGGDSKCTNSGGKKHHGLSGKGCEYLEDVQRNDPCKECGCMKWKVPGPADYTEGHHLGRGCSRCSGGDAGCSCNTGGVTQCSGTECQCAKEGKCCKCCCKGHCDKCKDAKCICDKEKQQGKENGGNTYDEEHRIHSYTSAYPYKSILVQKSFFESKRVDVKPFWRDLTELPGYYPGSASERRSKCARILLGSVCLIWTGITYMHWTGKWASGSPYWNNHILDGSGLDDGTLSQWLQALGFPREMLNNHGPGNRLDGVIWDGFRDKFLLGFVEPSGFGSSGEVNDTNGNTARAPFGMNYPGFVHTAHRDSFNSDATVFPHNGTTSGNTDQINETDQHKNGAVFKLYILSCAYFTGLQKKRTPSKAENRTPNTIREILYWLSALPYSPAYPKILEHSKGVLEKVAPDVKGTKTLSFIQTGRTHPITVDEFNLFAHFQAVTQYCPLVLIGIQGGIHSTKGTDSANEPPIHSLYANTACGFTYPEVKIQAYNQVVHYIRALFYQLYFLRKQCAVKVALGGKWRECRYGKDVLGKGVISWMCLGCDPMEHDRKWRVKEMGNKLNKLPLGSGESVAMKVKTLLEKIGEVVVQLGNAQEVLEKDVNNGSVAVAALNKVPEVNNGNDLKGVLEAVLKVVEEKVEALKEVVEKKVKGNGLAASKEELQEALSKAHTKLEGAVKTLQAAKKALDSGDKKNQLNAVHHWLHQVLEALLILKEWWNKIKANGCRKHLQDDIANAIDNIEDIVGSTRCTPCHDHINKCGKTPTPTTCKTCLQPTTTGVPSPLQAFLEDRLPGFSCQEVVNDAKDDPVYPPAASHLEHCGGSGQCCPLPMGFRGQFHTGSASNCTGARIYGILYFFSNENMMQSCVYTLVRVTAALSATTPQVLGDVFGFFRGGVGEKDRGKTKNGRVESCGHTKDPSTKGDNDYFCGWCASGLRDEVKKIEWIPKEGSDKGGQYRESVGQALVAIKGDKDSDAALKSGATTTTSLSALTEQPQYVSPLTGELYTAVSATFGGTYLSWVLYLSDALEGGLQSLASAFKEIECRGCRECDPNKCKKGAHGDNGGGQCGCQSIVSCTGVLPVLYRHGFSYGNPFNLEGYQQKDGEKDGQYDIEDKKKERTKQCHQFLESLSAVIENQQDTSKVASQNHPLTELLKQVGRLQYDIRLPWIFVLTIAWLVAVLYLAFGAIWPLDWTHMRSHWLRGGAHQWQCMWYKVMTGRKGVELIEYFGRK